MKERSTVTHEFYWDKDVSKDGCLYESFRFLNGTSKSSSNEGLRSLVADYILDHESIHRLVPKTDVKYKSIKDYCNQIKKGKSNGSEAELQALAKISKLVIHIISIKIIKGNVHIKPLNYGEASECIYLLYDEEKKHYNPLYIINKEDSREETMIFPPNDEIVNEILEKFIRDEFGVCYNYADDKQPSAEIISLSRTKEMVDQAVSTTSINLSHKQKDPSYENLSFAMVIGKHELTHDCDSIVVNKPKKIAKENIAETLEVQKENDGNIKQSIPSPTIEQHPQTDLFSEATEMITHSTTSSTEDGRRSIIPLLIEPAKKFRGRTRGDFKKQKNKKGKLKINQPRAPRYFADRNNKRVFYLLIPKKCITPNVDYRVKISLITRDIEGCSYIHPYFKFQGDPVDTGIPDENPSYFSFDMTDLEEYSEDMARLPIRWVIIQQTNPELMQVEQPLTIFSSSETGSAITTTYAKHRTFKKAYHLHDIRFAFTLYKRERGEREFRPYDDMQYISQISTEDKKHKISNK